MSNPDIKITLDLDAEGYRVSARSLVAEVQRLKGSLETVDPVVKKVDAGIRKSNGSFQSFLLTVGMLRFSLMSLYDVFGRLPMHIMKNAGELERMQQLMRGLSKETTDAARAIEGMRDFNFVTNMAKTAPFEITALSDSFVKLKVAGIDPTNGSMQTLVDSVAKFGGNSDILKRATVAISQMSGKSVVSMEELRQQLGEAIPNAMQAMADGFGLSMARLTKIVSTGTLAAGPAIKAMLRELRSENEGAAADMMSTWVGMQAQLKTEWMLTSKAIADAGFGGAMKDVLKDLTLMLKDPAFINWSKEFGSGLGDAIKSLATGVKLIGEYGDYIKYIAAAMLAYKLQTGLVSGMVGGMRAQYQKVGDSLRANLNLVKQERAERIKMMQEQSDRKVSSIQTDISGVKGTIEAQKRDLASSVSINQQRKQSHLSMLDAIEAKERQVSALQHQLDSGMGKRKTAAVTRELAAQTTELNSMRAASDKLHASIQTGNQVIATNARLLKNSSDSLKSYEAAVSSNNVALARAVSQYKAVNVAASAAAMAMRGAGAVVGALGGWVGLGITALIALVTWWVNVESAAERAAAAQERAARGSSLAKDIDDLKTAVKDQEFLVSKLKSDDVVLGTKTGAAAIAANAFGQSLAITRKKTSEELAKDAAAVTKQVEELDKLRESLRLAQENVEKATIDNSTAHSNAVFGMDTASKIEKDTQRLTNEIRQASKDHIATFKGTEEEKAKEILKFTRARYEAEARGKEQLAAAAAAKEAELTAKLASANDEQKKVLSAQIASYVKMQDEALAAADQYREQIEMVTFKEPDDKGGNNKVSAFEKLSRRVGADTAQLREQLENASKTGKRGHVVAGEIEALRARFAKGEFKGTTKSQFESVIDQIGANAKTSEALDRAEEMARNADRIASRIDDLKQRVEQAQLLMSDPVGHGRDGREQSLAFERDLERRTLHYRDYAERQGIEYANLVKSMRAEWATVDASDMMAKLAQSSRSIEEGMTATNRKENAARMALEIENFNQRTSMRIQEYRDRGVGETEINALEQQRIRNVTLLTQEMMIKTRTPMQVLIAEWDDFGTQMENSTARWANMAMDSFVELAVTGKASFRDLATTVLKETARMYAQKGFAQLLQFGIGSATSWLTGVPSVVPTPVMSPSAIPYSLPPIAHAMGGVMNEFGSVPLRKYAQGGVARTPQLALFGEGSHAEAYVPLPDGRTIPVTMQGGGGSMQNINISVVVNNDGESTTAEGGNKMNQDVARSMADKIKTVVREELLAQKRQGGILTS